MFRRVKVSQYVLT